MKLLVNITFIILFVLTSLSGCSTVTNSDISGSEYNRDANGVQSKHLKSYNYFDLITGRNAFSIIEDESSPYQENGIVEMDQGHIVNQLNVCSTGNKYICMYNEKNDFILSFPRNKKYLSDEWEFKNRLFRIKTEISMTLEGKNTKFYIVSSDFGEKTLRFYFSYKYGFYTILWLQKNKGFNTNISDNSLIPISIFQVLDGYGYGGKK